MDVPDCPGGAAVGSKTQVPEAISILISWASANHAPAAAWLNIPDDLRQVSQVWNPAANDPADLQFALVPVIQGIVGIPFGEQHAVAADTQQPVSDQLAVDAHGQHHTRFEDPGGRRDDDQVAGVDGRRHAAAVHIQDVVPAVGKVAVCQEEQE